MSVTYATILAGGEGLRFGIDESGLPKQFSKVSGKTLLELSVEAFNTSEVVDYIVVVTNERYVKVTNQIIQNQRFGKLVSIIPGGKTRFESSFQGLRACGYHAENNEINIAECKVLIHDAVRAFVNEEVIANVHKKLLTADAVQPIVPVNETLVQRVGRSWITQNRDDFATVQTPQGFHFSKIYEAYQHSIKSPTSSWTPTDDISVMQEYAKDAVIEVTSGDHRNRKVTYPEDLPEELLQPLDK
ncbi:MAG: 2-C-methyl-D-erythritol 4-phosphate cytidylyltransferase [Candidatus Ancillula sp.]|jgi:2-C-methyl-D-erythritol 4-phosphate cytidylyltransferase|nr:2-C-methyl-D-erythritol 4-phosphate cytidylyltransferase [Candidatus Ancillula sp.]